MKSLMEAPLPYLGFISLHLFLGHFGSSLLYRLRFGKSPLAYRSRGAMHSHTRITRFIALVSLIWAGSLIAAAFSKSFTHTFLGRLLFELPPWMGWGLGLIGLIGMLSAQYGMGEAFCIGVDEGEKSPILHEKGLHRISRNPIYLFSYLYLVGASLWAPSALTLVCALLLGALFRALILEEERFLSSRLGERYAHYCRRVRRYL